MRKRTIGLLFLTAVVCLILSYCIPQPFSTVAGLVGWSTYLIAWVGTTIKHWRAGRRGVAIVFFLLQAFGILLYLIFGEMRPPTEEERQELLRMHSLWWVNYGSPTAPFNPKNLSAKKG